MLFSFCPGATGPNSGLFPLAWVCGLPGRMMNRRAFSQLLTGALLEPSLRHAAAAAQPQPASAGTASFHFSIMLWTIDHQLPFERCLEIAAQAGYGGVELVGESDHWSDADFRRIKAKLDSLHLVCDSMACGGVRLADPNGAETILAALSRCMQAAQRLGCSQIIVTSGARMDNLSHDAQHAACIENLKQVAGLAAHRNMEIVVEPIDLLEQPRAYLDSVAEGFDIIRAVGSPHVKVLYDFYHEQRAAGNLIEKLEKNIEWVGLVHIADVPGRHEPGTGEIDYRNIYRKLAELNYNRFAAMEYYPTSDPLQSLRTARLVAEQAVRTPTQPYQLRA